jgi:predicted ArsR family transcriptional regulator
MDDPLATLAALHDPIRRGLFAFVCRSTQPVSRDAAAEHLSIPRATAAFHLDRLASAGLLDIEYQRLSGRSGPGAGRPSKLYRRAAGEVSVSVPPRSYDLAGELLAGAIEEAATTGRPVAETLAEQAREQGRRVGAASGALDAALENQGFQPRVDADGTIVLGNCPFHRLADRHTELVCGMNLDLLGGMAEGSGEAGRGMRLDPAPDRCCVRIAAT